MHDESKYSWDLYHPRRLVNQAKARNASRRVRTPNCTHINMDLIYGRELQCHLCGRPPSIGFLYECRQDCDTETLRDLIVQEKDKSEPAKSDLRLELESSGMSESIILTAEGGHYTDAQLTKLKELKLELRQVIADMEQKNDINDAMARLTSVAKSPSNNDGALNSALTKDAVSGSDI